MFIKRIKFWLRRNYLPKAMSEAAAAWSNGWWAGIAVGCVNGICLGIVLSKVAH